MHRAIVGRGRELRGPVVVVSRRCAVRLRGRVRLYRRRGTGGGGPLRMGLGVVLGLTVKHGAVLARGEGSVAVRVVILAVGRAAGAVAAVVAVVGVSVVAGGVAAVERCVVVVVIVHLDGGVCLLVMGCHGEGGLVGVDVVTAELLLVVTGELAVELVVLEGVQTDKGAAAKEKAVKVLLASLPEWLRSDFSDDLPHENTQADDGLAELAAVTALVGRVVGGLTCESRKPDDAEACVYDGHSVGVGQFSRSGPSRRHNQVDPRW